MDNTIPEPQTARCRACERNDVPVTEMAAYSWKSIFQKFTGICKSCFTDPVKMSAYYAKR